MDFQDFGRKTAGQMGALVCYTDTIENCTQAQGRRAGGVLFVCARSVRRQVGAAQMLLSL